MSAGRSSWKPLLFLAFLAVSGALFCPSRAVTRVFDAFEMHGGPVVVTTATDPMVLVLTSHRETPRYFSRRFALNRKGKLHWDLWSFSATDLSRRWITRVSTIQQGQLALDAGLLGVSNGTVWILADGLMAVSARDGKVIGDAAMIESRNAALRGLMPTTRRQFSFDDGLVIVAADGQRWRVHHETLLATRDTSVARTSLIGVPVSRATGADQFLPLKLSSQYQAFKSRSYVVGDTWFGMMHPSEVEQQRTDPHTQAFAQGLRYRLWAAPLRDTVNRFRDPVRLPVDYAPRAASPEFLLGGLLTIPDASGREGVVGIANPTRFLVVHQDRIDAAATQTLTCIGLDGKVCWSAPLNVSIATGFARLTAGGPANWALIFAGETRARRGDTLLDPSADGMPALGRVAMSDGSTQQMRFSAIDLAALAKEVVPYRSR